jgi:hypothetical protein
MVLHIHLANDIEFVFVVRDQLTDLLRLEFSMPGVLLDDGDALDPSKAVIFEVPSKSRQDIENLEDYDRKATHAPKTVCEWYNIFGVSTAD